MPRKIKNAKRGGVAVKISPPNAIKIIEICLKTHRTFASEVNMAVEEYTEHFLAQQPNRKDDGR